MNEPTEEEQVRLWEWCGLVHINNPIPTEVANSCEAIAMDKPLNGWYYPDYTKGTSKLISLREVPVLDLDNLFKYAPDIIVGVSFRYFLGGCKCELAYTTKAGFDWVESWIDNNTGYENKSKDLSPLALFWAIYKVIEGGKQ